MFFGNLSSVLVKDFGQGVDHVFIHIGMRDQVHVAHVDAGHVFAQIAVRVGFDGHREIKRVLFEFVRGIGVEFDELNILFEHS